MKFKISKSKNGTLFASLTFYDKSSVFNLVLFGDKFHKFKDTLKEGNNYVVEIITKSEEDELRIFIENIVILTPTYKIKKISSKKVEPNKLSITVTLSSVLGIDNLNDLIINKKGSDVAIVKILNDKNYLVFEISDIMIMKDQIEKTKTKEDIIEIVYNK